MCANTQSASIKRIVRCEKQINKQKATSLRETAGSDFLALYVTSSDSVILTFDFWLV